jgi:hypothetical protein
MLNVNLCNEYIYHVVLTECQTKYVEEPQTGRSVSKLEASAESLGRKYLYLSEGQFTRN